MKGRWIAQRFEDKFSYGIPDIGFVMKAGCQSAYGFLELKRLKDFPKRESTPVSIPHKKHWQIQQAWAARVGALTGRVFLLLQVERAYFLFNWRQMQEVGTLTVDGLIENSLASWSNRIDYAELVDLLSKEYK